MINSKKTTKKYKNGSIIIVILFLWILACGKDIPIHKNSKTRIIEPKKILSEKEGITSYVFAKNSILYYTDDSNGMNKYNLETKRKNIIDYPKEIKKKYINGSINIGCDDVGKNIYILFYYLEKNATITKFYQYNTNTGIWKALDHLDNKVKDFVILDEDNAFFLLWDIDAFAIYNFEKAILKIENFGIPNERWTKILTKINNSTDVCLKGYEVDGKISYLIYKPYTKEYSIYKLAFNSYHNFNHVCDRTFVCNSEYSYTCKTKQAKIFTMDLRYGIKNTIVLGGIKCPVYLFKRIHKNTISFCKRSGFYLPFSSGITKTKDILYTVELESLSCQFDQD